MDGLLVVDKPAGPTSHDVVARVRRVLGERRVGHTGTLDPIASGVLPLVLGRATRLARFFSGVWKSYEAEIRLGVATVTYDRTGTSVGTPYAGPIPSLEAIDCALEKFRGTFLQQPPAYSAKKIGGVPSYARARAASRRMAERSDDLVWPAPVSVTARIEIGTLADRVLTLRVSCSAGFYVRSLAHDLGLAVGTGGHLAALRRTVSGDITLAHAVPLAMLEHDAEALRAAVVPMGRLLPSLAAVTLSEEGVTRACQGRDLGPDDSLSEGAGFAAPALWTRLLDQGGDLVGLAEPSPTPGLLHPAVVLR